MRQPRPVHLSRLRRLLVSLAIAAVTALSPVILLPAAAAPDATLSLVPPTSVGNNDPGPLVITTPTPQDAFALETWGNGNQFYRVGLRVTAGSSPLSALRIQIAVQANCAQGNPLDLSYWDGNTWHPVTPACASNIYTYTVPDSDFSLNANQTRTFELKLGFPNTQSNKTYQTTISLTGAMANTLSFTLHAGISAAVSDAAANATVRVAPGTYQEQVTINKNLTIQGSGQAGPGATLLKPADTLSQTNCNGPVTAAIAVVAPASTATLQNLAIDYSGQNGATGVLFCGVNGSASALTIKADTGVVADNSGSNTAHTVTLNNVGVTLGNNNGVAIQGIGNNGNLTLNVSTSTLNGGNNLNQNGIALTAAQGTLQSNTIKNTGVGIAINNTSGPVTISANTLTSNATGMSLTQSNNVNVTNNTLSSPTNGTAILATDSATTIQGNTIQNGATGIAVKTISGTANVNATSNVITGTTGAALSRDATANATGTVFNAHGNRIVINSGLNAQSNGGTLQTFDARYNWWGQNVPPANSFSGNLLYQPVLQLALNVTPTTLPPNSQAQVVATIAGGGYTVPDGTTVTFGTNLAIATIAPMSATFSNGQASATLTALQSGVVSVSATVDNQTITVPVTITAAAASSLTLTPSTQTVTVGNTAQLTATLVNPSGPVANVIISVTVTGANPRTFTAVTNASGQATIAYSGSNTGTDTVTATAQITGNPTATATVNWTAAAPPPPSGSFGPAQPAQPINNPNCIYFPQTQHNLCYGFRAYWEQFGGLATYGYPITEEFQETNPDTGKVYTVQYFERARYEWHPGEFPQRYDVLLGRLGAQVTAGRQNEPPFRPAQPNPAASCIYFPQTQHNLCGGFRAYWEQFGGLATYGYPISEEFQEVNPDTGKVYTVQYFERARYEWHPGEFPQRYDVLLGRLGALVLHNRYGTPYP